VNVEELPVYDRTRAKATVQEVVEGIGPPFDPIATGRFDAAVTPAEQRTIMGPQGASLDVAVEWARAAAAQVMVFLGFGLYSAGEDPPEWNEDAPPLPPTSDLNLGRRRQQGWEHLDRTDADPVIQWDVVVRRAGAPVSPSAVDAMIRTLAGASDVVILEFRFARPPFAGEKEPDQDEADDREPVPAVGFVLRVSGRTTAEVCTRAAAACGVTYDDLRDSNPLGWKAEAFPTESEWAGRYAHTGRPGTRR
jgi:hypothetical protein